MSDRFSQYCYSVCRQAAQELGEVAAMIGRRLARTPLPAIIIWAICLLLLISLIPLMVTLFITLVVLRLLLGAFSKQPVRPAPTRNRQDLLD